ncbi:Zinc finger protein-like 1-like [Vitis vinifera]|uniref:Zinc finger protein-like 1-like n=1 Tax=Vitis vinifera TaxID=29760 RepID=A0A438GJR0_VITVI|nr:Zinc finger protein-like 1-like [Vitis vinifera]
MRWWSANAERLTCEEVLGFRQPSCTVSCTRSRFVENASVFLSTKYAWYGYWIFACLTCVRTYSEWVIDGEYDWPPTCCLCQAALQEGTDSQTTRLGCLHIIHTNCLVSHIKSFPPHTAPAGYACPACSTSIWPPKSVRDSGSRLHSKLKEAIMQVKSMPHS